MTLIIKMPTISIKLIIFVFLFSALFMAKDYVKIIHNIDPEAKCLDGTPGLLYVH
jgi:hypothetical protein